MKRRRCTTLVITAALLAGLLTGCKSGGCGSETTAPTQTSATTTPTDPTTEPSSEQTTVPPETTVPTSDTAISTLETLPPETDATTKATTEATTRATTKATTKATTAATTKATTKATTAATTEATTKATTAATTAFSLDPYIGSGETLPPETGAAGIAIPGWGSITLCPNDGTAAVDLINPAANAGNYYLSFELRLADTGEVVFATGYVAGGNSIGTVKLVNTPAAGTYAAVLKVQPCRPDGSLTNNAEIDLTLVVE